MSPILSRSGLSLAALAAAVGLAGCANMPFGNKGDGAAAPAPAAAAAPAAPKTPPGMNDRGEVVDSRKVESGNGSQKVKGLNDWEGEIHGKPGPGSKFGQLKIGMSVQQVINLVGQPSDQGAYITGKAWIPFYFGSDRSRYEAVYKGQGRLIFATSAGWGWGSTGDANLIWIIHSANESGTR